MDFASRLKEYREKAGFSQRELAHKVGVDPVIIGRYEQKNVLPRIDTALKLAYALGCTVDDLAGYAVKDDKMKTIEGFRNELSTDEHRPFTVKELADLLQKLTDAGWGDHVCQYEDGACQVITVEIGPNGVFFHNY